MENKVNLYFSHDCGYRLGMVHEMLSRGIIDFCLTDYDPGSTNSPPPIDSRIVTTEISMGVNLTYDKVCNIYELPMPSKELLEAMRPYESMAIKMGSRRTNYQIALYEEEKRNYLLHVRYWNYMLDKYNINFCFFENTPHTQHIYIIYALAQVKRIPTIVMLAAVAIPGIYVYGDRIGNAGDNVADYYLRMLKENRSTNIELSGVVKDYYEKHTQKLDKLKNEINPGVSKESKTLQKKFIEMYYSSCVGFKVSKLKTNMLIIRERLRKLLDHSNRSLHDERLSSFYLKKKRIDYIKLYKSYELMDLDEYDSIAELPDYNQKYIYFGIQRTPEETTIPKAGVFSEQYNSIQLLARVAQQKNIYVYVKEHFLQPWRERYFFEDLKKIPNVRLIKTTVSTYDMIYNSLAVSTQTGSCILEGALMGKPSLVIGDGYAWKSMPGLFEIFDEESGNKALDKILDNYKIDSEKLKLYFYAIEKSSYLQTYGLRPGEHVQDKLEKNADYREMEKLYEIIDRGIKKSRKL